MKQEKKMFYQRTVDDVMSQMKAHPTGLTDQEVRSAAAVWCQQTDFKAPDNTD